jgi:hypothetical protein
MLGHDSVIVRFDLYPEILDFCAWEFPQAFATFLDVPVA